MSELQRPNTPPEDQVLKDPEKVEYPETDSGDPSILPDEDAEKATPPTPTHVEPPDGGAVAWLVVLGTWCTSICSFGWLNSMLTSHHMCANTYTDNVQVLEFFRSTIKTNCSLPTHLAPSHGFRRFKSSS